MGNILKKLHSVFEVFLQYISSSIIISGYLWNESPGIYPRSHTVILKVWCESQHWKPCRTCLLWGFSLQQSPRGWQWWLCSEDRKHLAPRGVCSEPLLYIMVNQFKVHMFAQNKVKYSELIKSTNKPCCACQSTFSHVRFFQIKQWNTDRSWHFKIKQENRPWQKHYNCDTEVLLCDAHMYCLTSRVQHWVFWASDSFKSPVPVGAGAVYINK